MEAQQSKKNNTPIIIAVVVIVLCCFCLIAGAAGYYVYNLSKTGQFNFSPTDTFTPIPPILNDNPSTAAPNSSSDFGDAPIGGLGNDVLRKDTWDTMAPAAVGLGCDKPLGADTTIDVIQQPDANGTWVEHWNVACQSGKTYTFEVQFILDPTGATFNIKYLP